MFDLFTEHFDHVGAHRLVPVVCWLWFLRVEQAGNLSLCLSPGSVGCQLEDELQLQVLRPQRGQVWICPGWLSERERLCWQTMACACAAVDLMLWEEEICYLESIETFKVVQVLS